MVMARSTVSIAGRQKKKKNPLILLRIENQPVIKYHDSVSDRLQKVTRLRVSQ